MERVGITGSSHTGQAAACLTENDALDLVDQRLSPEQRAIADDHLDACDACRRLVSGLARRSLLGSPTPEIRSGTWSDDTEWSTGETPWGDRVLAPGRTLGRYVILEPVGAGGMGIVYAAYDPRLKRKIALKLVRVGGVEPGDARAHRLGERLVREAQAMARVTHPNVTTVHDAGNDGADVFIAMEMVEGSTLGAWLLREPRHWREILTAFMAAGRGLAAAHAAGLVHRDFKPDNVLVANDGRVSVSDFGLVRVADLDSDGVSGLPEALGSATTTRPGATLGTPAYMAPEQLEDPRSADARSDQYSFCAALHEALWGTRPNGKRSTLPFPPARGNIPRRLRHIVGRGGSLDPAHRFASMNALLDALARGKRSRSRTTSIAVAAIATLSAVTVIASRRAEPANAPCSGAASQLNGVWDIGRKHAVLSALLEHGVAYAPTTARAVERTLDDYSHRWIAMHSEACEATSVRHEQPDSVLALRMACLEQRREELSEAVGLLADPSTSLDRAVIVATSVPSVEQCGDLAALAAPVPPPSDLATTIRVGDLRRRLARAKAQADAGMYDAGASAAEALVQEARALGYAPLVAEIFFRMGVAWANGGRAAQSEHALDDAILAAEAGRDDDLAAKALALDVMVVGYMAGRFDDGTRLAARAEAKITRLATLSPRRAYDVRGRLLASQSGMAMAHDDDASAVALGEQALHHFEQTFGPEAPETARMHQNLGGALEGLNRFDDAMAHSERALAILTANEGAQHPDVTLLENNIGGLLMKLGRDDEAARRLEHALAAAETVDPHSAAVMRVLFAFAKVRLLQHRYAETLELADRCLAIATTRTLPPQDRIMVHGYRAFALAGLKRDTEARDAFRTGIEEGEHALGANHQALAYPLENQGLLAARMGNACEAAALFERALSIVEANHGPRQAADSLREKLAAVRSMPHHRRCSRS